MIYVTGANGWIGLNLIKNLIKKKYHNWDLRDNQINALILKDTPKDSLMSISPNINIVEGDVLSKSSLEIFFKNSKDAIIFHTAGVIHPKKIRDFYEINLTGTKNILIEAATVNESGETINIAKKKSDLLADEDAILNLKHSAKVIIVTKLGTGNNGSAVKIYSTHSMKIKLGLMAKVTFELDNTEEDEE